MISEVKYRLTMAPRKGGDSFLGKVLIEFNLSQDATQDHDSSIFVDYKGRCVNKFAVNGTAVTDSQKYINERLYIPESLRKAGQKNQVEVLFESEYVTNCEGVHYFKDDADEQEYIYTSLEPANCHVWFPCFD
jgi:aminopeptidase N